MSGDSRLYYHAVPKVLKSDYCLLSQAEDPEVVEYMSVNRVNLTIRQVNKN